MNIPEISVVLGSYNRRAFLKPTIESIRNNGATVPYEIIVVDGGSTDGSLQWLSKQKDIITIIQHNRGTFRGKPIPRRSWGYFMNLGFKASQGKYILMISDDCLLVPNAMMQGHQYFEALVAQEQNLGALAFYWRNWPSENAYKVGLTLGNKLFVNHGMYLRAALEEIGWIDEESFRFYHADGDLCLKLWQAGYVVKDCPTAFIEHCTHANLSIRRSNNSRQRADWAVFLEKWQGIFYDPNEKNIGKWIYRQYMDPHHTVKLFPKKAITLFYMQKILEVFKKSLVK